MEGSSNQPNKHISPKGSTLPSTFMKNYSVFWSFIEVVSTVARGGSRGGGVPGGQDPPPLFWGGTPKLHKKGKKLHACTENAEF